VYPEQTVSLNPGDQVVFFTDGVIEAVNADGEVFGSDRIDAALCDDLPTAADLVLAILRELSDFTPGAPIADDRTLVVVKRT
jgi:sigma-B regulation protein RsbU (phosphoserine phosphatase)